MMPLIECRKLSFTWNTEGPKPTRALEDVTFSVGQGQIVAIIGPTGCGKSTLLQLIGGFEFPTNGEILFSGSLIEGPSAERGIIFQNPCLYPWLTIRGNVEFGPRMNGIESKVRRQLADKIIARVGLAGAEGKFPNELSGGMRQRVAIARALVTDPSVILMDEPFSALDFQTRLLMGQFLLELWAKFKITILFVSHSIDEVLLIADKVIVMSNGPGHIIDTIDVNLVRPRDLTTPDFNHYRLILTQEIRREAMKAFEADSALTAPIER